MAPTSMVNQPHEELGPLGTSDKQAPHTLHPFSLICKYDDSVWLKVALEKGGKYTPEFSSKIVPLRSIL